MKTTSWLLATAATLGITLPAFGNTCAFPSERAALELHALQSHLSVVAIRCRQEEQYAAFVRRHQGDLVGAGRTAQAHFRRAHGAQGVAQFSRYSTDLIGAHGQDVGAYESFACRDNASLFQQAVTAPTSVELIRMAVRNNVLMTYEPAICAAAPARTPAARAPRARRT